MKTERDLLAEIDELQKRVTKLEKLLNKHMSQANQSKRSKKFTIDDWHGQLEKEHRKLDILLILIAIINIILLYVWTKI